MYEHIKTMLRVLYTQNILYDHNGLYGQSRNCGWIPSWGNGFLLFFRTPRQSWDRINILANGQRDAPSSGVRRPFRYAHHSPLSSPQFMRCGVMSSLIPAKKLGYL